MPSIGAKNDVYRVLNNKSPQLFKNSAEDTPVKPFNIEKVYRNKAIN